MNKSLNDRKDGERQARSEALSLRATPEEKRLIARAAKAANKSRSQFMLDAATAAAQGSELILLLSAKDFQRLSDALNAPALPNENLRRLLNAGVPWDTNS